MKRSVTLLFLMTFVILSLGFISSADTINISHPKADVSISGTYVISGILDTNTINLSHAWFYLMHYNGTNITLASHVINGTGGVFNYSLNTANYLDANNFTIWMTVTNETGNCTNTTDYSTGVDIDGGSPTASWSSASFSDVTNGYSVNHDSTASFTAGLSADATRGISSCIIVISNIKNGTITGTTATTSGNACSNTTLTGKTIGTSGQAYNILIQATDGNGNKTNSSVRRLNVISADSGSSGGGGNGGATGGVSQSFLGAGFGDAMSNIWDGIVNFFKFKWLTELF